MTEPAQTEEGRLSDERVAELLRQAQDAPASFDTTLLAVLLEIHVRRLGDKVPTPPQRRTQLTSETLEWARGALEFAAQNLYDDPYGVAGESQELAVLEAWEELEAVAAELELDLQEIAGRCATEYERGRMEKILVSGRWAKTQAAGSEPEEAEAL